MASTRLRPMIEKRMLRPSLTLAVVRETVTDTSFDTNPAQQRETQGNAGGGYLACLCRFRNHEQRSETQRLRLRIRRSQVRVLPSVNKDLLGTRKSLHILKDIAHSYPLEAHLCCSVVKLGMEPKLGKVCNFGTARWRRSRGTWARCRLCPYGAREFLRPPHPDG